MFGTINLHEALALLAVVRGLAVLVLISGSASADPARLEIVSGVCDLQALAPQVVALVGHEPFSSDSSGSVRVDTDVFEGHVQARIDFDDGDGHHRGPRVVNAQSCTELIEAVAIVVAMAMPEHDSPKPTPAPILSEEPRVELHMPPPEARIPVAEETDMMVGGAGGVTTRGWQQEILLGVRWKRASRSLGAELRIEAPEAVQVTSMARISVWKSELSLSPCVHAASIGACAILTAGLIRGAGDGLIGSRAVVTPLVTTGLRLTWERSMTDGVSARVHLEIDTSLTTTRFDVDHMQVWTTNRFEGWGGLGVIARFP
ncbi:MAG: hypothetical protein JWO36_1083 [Myxococcales bacterium]|nr:hypothetical protein [Myxococcales bacterium]